MTLKLFTSLIFVGAAIAATSARADGRTLTVASGNKLQVFSLSQVNPDCTSRGEVHVRVLNPPAHGVLSIRPRLSFPNLPASDPYVHCKARRVPSTLIDYRPQPEFIGTDYITIEEIYPDGFDRTRSVTVIVK